MIILRIQLIIFVSLTSYLKLTLRKIREYTEVNYNKNTLNIRQGYLIFKFIVLSKIENQLQMTTHDWKLSCQHALQYWLIPSYNLHLIRNHY